MEFLNFYFQLGYSIYIELLKVIQKFHGTRVKLIMTFHSKTTGNKECTIHTLQNKLRECVIAFKGNWDQQFPLIYFSYNNFYHSSIGIDPLEAFYSRRCRCLLCRVEVGEVSLIGAEIVYTIH